MILPFSKKINGKETFFVEKIWQSFDDEFTIDNIQYYEFVGYQFHKDSVDFVPKLHTIREDKNDRWQVGTNIDFFINVRQKSMFRFAPRLPVVSVQEIEFREYDEDNFTISIDGKTLNEKQLNDLAINDGFDNVKDFLQYFDYDFKGKIIHWTDLRY